MNWPFVRRAKYEHLVKCLAVDSVIIGNQTERINTQRNEIISLQKELSIELNSHKETKDALKIAQEDTRQHRMSIDLADEKEEKIKQYLLKVINYI